MAQLYFIAHPKTEVTPSRPVQEWQLSDAGIVEARRLFELPWWEKIHTIYSSPEGKALSVAQMGEVRFDITVEVEECLRELDRHDGKVLEYDDFIAATKQLYAAPETAVQGWERGFDAADRIFRCVQSCMNQHPEDVVAVLSHPMVGGLLHSQVRRGELSYELDDPKSTSRYFVVDWETQRIIQDWTAY